VKVRLSIPVLLALATSGVLPAAGQDARGIVVGAGVGATYYCIVSRCDSGGTIGVMGAFDASRVLSVEAGVRRHYCFDCDRFMIAEADVLVQYPRQRVSPFLAAGLSYSSDAEFMGDHVGLLAAAGAWIRLRQRWGARLELRGRQVGRGDAMGELSLSMTHRFVRPGG
jgi:hypothetical protein